MMRVITMPSNSTLSRKFVWHVRQIVGPSIRALWLEKLKGYDSALFGTYSATNISETSAYLMFTDA